MGRQQHLQKSDRKNMRAERAQLELVKQKDVITDSYTPSKIVAQTFNQEQHLAAACSDPLVVAIGPAGTGKTFLSSAVAAKLYKAKQYKQLVLVRPTVECGESLGALPGELEEKYDPFLKPFYKGLIDQLGKNKLQNDMGKNILPYTIQHMRGESFEDTIILVDEAQNTTIEQMKMLITRPGENCRLIIMGDVKQTDIRGKNGLQWLVDELTRQQKPYDIIQYTMKDCVRSGFCLDMLNLIDKAQS